MLILSLALTRVKPDIHKFRLQANDGDDDGDDAEEFDYDDPDDEEEVVSRFIVADPASDKTDPGQITERKRTVQLHTCPLDG